MFESDFPTACKSTFLLNYCIGVFKLYLGPEKFKRNNYARSKIWSKIGIRKYRIKVNYVNFLISIQINVQGLCAKQQRAMRIRNFSITGIVFFRIESTHVPWIINRKMESISILRLPQHNGSSAFNPVMYYVSLLVEFPVDNVHSTYPISALRLIHRIGIKQYS